MQITAHTPTVLGVSPIVTPLNDVRINNRLNSAYWRVNVVQNTGSTQDDLVRSINEGSAKSGEVLIAEFQSAGRGRLQRQFIAPPGAALLFSAYVIPRSSSGSWGWLPLLASQAVHRSLESQIGAGARLSLKWPNDLLLNDLKIAGLLCERVDSAQGAGLVIGVGINVTTSKEQLPIATASSLELEGYSNLDREGLVVSILQNLTTYLKRWESADDTLVAEYLEFSSTIGKLVRVEMPTGVIHESKAVGIANTGSLILENGSVISAGDVVHLR